MSDKFTVRVTARSDSGFRRIGRFFGNSATDVEVTAAELEILKAETQLVVIELDGDGNAIGGEQVATLETEKADLVAKVAALEGEKADLQTKLADEAKARKAAESAKVALENEKADLTAKVAALEKAAKPK
jgi:hypothetical protein